MADEEVGENIEDSQAFKLFLSMKRYLEFQQAVQNELDNAEDDQGHSNAQAILRHSELVRTEIWVQLEAKLIILMDTNKISLPGKLVQPQSYQDFDVLEFLLRYVLTAPDQRRSLPTPLARSISPTWTGWFMQKGVSWISAGGSTGGKFATSVLQLLAAVLAAKLTSGVWNWSLGKGQETDKKDTADTEPEDTADTEPEDEDKGKGKGKGKHNEDLDLVGQIAKAALGKFLKDSFSDDASTSGF